MPTWMQTAWESIQRWQHLRALGNSRLVKTSYIWLFLVPIAARMFEAVPDPIILVINEHDIPIPTSLPFRWQMFYFMSFFFALGQFFYAIYCPRIVKDFATYNEYTGAHAGYSELDEMLQEIVVQYKDPAHVRQIDAKKTLQQILTRALSSKGKDPVSYVSSFAVDNYPVQEFLELRKNREPEFLSRKTTGFLGWFSSDSVFMNDLFDLLRNYQSTGPSLARNCSTASFGIGFIFFALLVAKSFYVVLLQALNNLC